MKVYCVSIPVPSTYYTDVIYTDLLFTTSPTKQQVIKYLEMGIPNVYDETDPLYCYMVEQVNNLKDSINQVNDWVMLNNLGLVRTNTYVNVTLRDKTVKAPFSWDIKDVINPSVVV